MARPKLGGYRRDLEDVDALEASAYALPEFEGVMFEAPPISEPWLQIHQENQAQLGSCQGHSLSTCVELCSKILNGDYTQLSRMYSYIETQRLDGLIGADRGSTVWGGVQLAESKGLCTEEMWPYYNKYTTKPPIHTLAECYADAANHKLKKHVKLSSYEDVSKFINLGIGGVHWGIGWNSSCEAKVCEYYRSGWGDGGHSIPLIFRSPRTNSKGESYYWMNNSWGENWCNHGWSEWSPDFIRGLFDDKETVAYGLTDMDDPAPRPVSYIGRLGD